MKKRNLLLTLAATALIAGGVLNVKAANASVDPSVCKDNTVYTNYYYLADAFFRWENHEIEDFNKDRITRGIYTDIVQDEIKSVIGTKNFITSNDIVSETGIIELVGSGTSDDLNKMTLTDFWTNFKIGTKGNIVTTSNGTTYVTNRIVNHTWAEMNGTDWSDVSQSSGSTAHATVDQLVKASVKLPFKTGDINYQNNSTTAQAHIDITRRYSEGATYYFTDHAAFDVERDDGTTAHVYEQPALYYVQYCIRGTNNNNNNNNNNNTKSEYTVTYNANKGVDAPKAVTNSTSSCVTIAEAGNMNRSGYKFAGWSLKEDATTPDKDYEPGKGKYCGPNNITLYAVWEAENPETGVNAHILAFGLAAIAAGAALVIARKKGLFKQI